MLDSTKEHLQNNNEKNLNELIDNAISRSKETIKKQYKPNDYIIE